MYKISRHVKTFPFPFNANILHDRSGHHNGIVFSRPYLVRSRLCYSVASVVWRLWRYVLWLYGAS